MIEVRVVEVQRRFKVRVGLKEVGLVTAGEGWATAWVKDDSGEYADHQGNFRNIRRAVRRVLEYHGYGKPQSVTVKATRLTRPS